MGLFGKKENHTKCLKQIEQLQEDNQAQANMIFVLHDDIKRLEEKIIIHEEIHPDLKNMTQQGDVSDG